MKTLSTEHRRQLERTVVEARDIAEAGARGALEALAVHHHEPYGHMSSEQRKLRNRLRAHARHLGDRVDARSGTHAIDHLVHECAYEHWHGMLFARFLAENHLLIEPEMGVAITLDECEELAKEEGVDKWALAARFAHRMLPQVFRPDHPVFEIQFAREYRLKLESLVEALPEQVFTATDALGWVYQFWQTKKKDEVNRSEVKIGADELPAVTQLFTEPYMVQFLLHNSLGAWWVTRHPGKACPVDLTYLRRTEEGTPVAGVFEGWPDDLSEFRLLDPCCGSGHFLVAAFLMLVPMRMALERMDAAAAADAVLRENIHGLELDQRCVAIAAFALALEAWRYPDAVGFRTLSKLNLAWCGQPVAGKKEQWLALAEGDSRLEAGMAALYDTFRDAPTLGSLIDPARSVSEDMLTAGFEEVQPLLKKALREHAGEDEWEETAIAALGLAEATRLLSDNYHLVVTNVPYLARGKQSERLRKFAEMRYPSAKNDLANIFLERCLEFTKGEITGATQIVMPQNWLFLTGYKAQREHLLKDVRWKLLARLGSGAFETISGAVVNVILLTLTSARPHSNSQLRGIDASEVRTVAGKSDDLRTSGLATVTQRSQLENPDCRIAFGVQDGGTYLSEVAECYQGIVTGDIERFTKKYWEVVPKNSIWMPFRRSNNSESLFGDVSEVLLWEQGAGALHAYAIEARHQLHDMHESGNRAWGRKGVAINRMGGLRAVPYYGEHFDNNVAVLFPKTSEALLPGLFAFLHDVQFHRTVRDLDQAIKVTNQTLLKVPFDVQRWSKAAASELPDGLPLPYSDDCTQWAFHGHPRAAASGLQVAIAHLLGYRWPAESDPQMELADEARSWVSKAKALHRYDDEDGIVCVPSVRGERPAHERLLELFNAAYGADWHDGILTQLLAEPGCASLDDWLRNKFFEDHCKVFHHRPFIWHIWDGRKRDGFHALVNYHKLAEGDGKGRRLLESLTYSYLGDWIGRQQDGVKRGEGGAEDRLAAALELQKRLVAILEGEPPFDIFVRWKPIVEQPIGWEPDINDGVRLNIRPFMAQDLTGSKKGAGILRAKPNIHWKKDRGKEPSRDHAQFPWFWKSGKFTGERVNDVHLTIAEKRLARERARGKT
jgi:hypothetical protein